MTDTDLAARDLRAALVFDRPVLRASDAPGVRAFLEILDLHWHWEEVDDSPLGRAAVGLKATLSGDSDAGRSVFAELSNAPGADGISRLTRLLGHALLAWSSDWDDGAIESAVEEASQLEDQHAAALYLLKLAGFALDNGERDRASALLSASLTRVPDDRPRLRWRLEQTAASVSGGLLITAPPDDRDPLADFPWVRERAAGAASEALKKSAEGIVADPWLRTIHFGSTPLDSVMSAVLQAEWAGALWDLAPIRLQQAAMTVISGGRSIDEWERAAVSWVLGGGSRLRDFFRAVEPHFDAGSVRRVVEVQLVSGQRMQRLDRYVEVLLAVWDLLDEDLARGVLDGFEPGQASARARDDTDALWAVLGAVVPNAWAERLAELSPQQQSALLPHLTPGLVQRLHPESVEVLVDRCIDAMVASAVPQGDVAAEPFRAAGVLIGSETLDEQRHAALAEQLGHAPAPVRAELLLAVDDLAGVVDAPAVLADALASVRGDAVAAREGRYTMYARSPVGMAASLAVRFASAREALEIAQEILGLAFDPSVLVDFRLEALQAAFRLALSHEFDELVRPSRDSLMEFGADPFGSAGDVTFQRALLECTRYVAAPSPAALPRVLGLARDPDARVRQIAVRAIADAIGRGEGQNDQPVLWSTVVGALFDPSESVVDVGLQLIASAAGVPDELATVVVERLQRLFREGGRDTRASVLRSCVGVRGRDPEQTHLLDRLVQEGAEDRSWLVRDVVTKGPDGRD